MSENAGSSSRTRHMDTRWHFVNQLQDQGPIKIIFVRSAANTSDVMCTKNVTGETFDSHIRTYAADKDDIED